MLVSQAIARHRRAGTPAGHAARRTLCWRFSAAPSCAGLAIGVPFVLLDWGRFTAAMIELSHAMAVGDPRLGLSNGWLHHLQFSLRYGMGLPLLVFGLAGAVAMLVLDPRLRRPRAVISHRLLRGIAGSINLLFFRYAMPTVPFLCVTAAYGCSVARGVRVGRRHGSCRRATGVSRW